MASAEKNSLLRSARREAVFAVTLWLLAVVYSVSVCYWLGYNRPAADLRFIAGIPTWVLYGIVAPWLICTIVSAWYSFFFAADEDFEAESRLGEEHLAEEAEHDR